MDREETVVLWKSVLSSGNGFKYRLLESVSVLELKFVFDNSKNDYIVAEKNFCFHRENTLREERNNVRIYAGLSDGHRPDR